MRAVLEQRVGHMRTVTDQVLTAIQDEQQLPVTQVILDNLRLQVRSRHFSASHGLVTTAFAVVSGFSCYYKPEIIALPGPQEITVTPQRQLMVTLLPDGGSFRCHLCRMSKWIFTVRLRSDWSLSSQYTHKLGGPYARNYRRRYDSR